MNAPRAIVIAGPNGAGKSSAAPAVLRDFARVTTYINADVIAQGLSAFDPAAAAFEAGRIMLARIEALIDRREDFAFESTLSGVTAADLLRRARGAGYATHVFYLWLPTVGLSIERVRLRVAAGGHDVPEPTIRRRFGRSLRNFLHTYQPLADEWRLYDASGIDDRPLVATGVHGDVTIIDPARWARVKRAAAGREEHP